MVSWFKKYWVYFAIAISIGAFLLFKNFLNDNGQALMVLITAIYVIATINISNANIKSAEATREQVLESTKQYEDSRHLQIMPFIRAYFSRDKAPDYPVYLPLGNEIKDKEGSGNNIQIENIGKGAAIDVSYAWKYGSIEDKGTIGVAGIKEGAQCKLDLAFFGDLENEITEGLFILYYCDLLGKKYEQEILLKVGLNAESRVVVDEVETRIPKAV